MTPHVSTIIVNYNTGELLKRCVDSLLKCPLNIEIIIVDNASRDDSLKHITMLPHVRVIQNSANLGFATACNLGLKAASAPYLLFLNPDCSFEPGALCRLLEALQSDRRVGVAGGLLLNEDGSEQAGGRRAVPTPWRSFVRAFRLNCFAGRWPRLFDDFYLHHHPLPSDPVAVEAISGACMLARREAMADVGLLDEGYFLHCEDLDWCMRFRQKGWRVLFVPGARFIHLQGGSSRERELFVEWHKHKGMMRFYRKFFRHQYPGILMPLVVMGVWLRFGALTVYHLGVRAGAVLGNGRE